MTHLPYIAAAYSLAVAVSAWFSISAWLRLRRAEARLAALDTRTRGR